MYACIAGPVFGRSIIPVSPQPHRKNTCSAFLLCTGPGTCIIPTILLHRIEDCGIHKLCAFATEVEFSPRQRIPAFRFLVAGSCYPTPGFWLLAPSSHFPLTRDPRHAINPLAKSAKSLKLLLQAATAKWQ